MEGKNGKCLSENRVEKLREYLRGKALKLIPESIKSIAAAYTVLQEAFGDPARVLEHKLEAMDELGPFPSDKVGKGLPGYGNQVDWLLRIEGIVRDIIELGEEYVQLDRDAFSTATIKRILERFPEKVVAKFNRLKGDGKAKMKTFQSILYEKRADTQGLDNTNSNLRIKPGCSVGGAGSDAGNGAGGGAGNDSGGGRKQDKTVQYSDLARYDASVFFTEPETFSECRICNTLSTEGETNNLFSNHIINYAMAALILLG